MGVENEDNFLKKMYRTYSKDSENNEHRRNAFELGFYQKPGENNTRITLKGVTHDVTPKQIQDYMNGYVEESIEESSETTTTVTFVQQRKHKGSNGRVRDDSILPRPNHHSKHNRSRY